MEPARLYLNRIIAALTGPIQDPVTLEPDFQLDVAWFDAFLSKYNGISLIPRRPLKECEAVELDSCLTGCGAIFGRLYYMEKYPSKITSMNLPIHCLEMLNIVIAVRLWAPKWAGCLVNIWCDNKASVMVLQSGKGRDERLLKCVREIWAWAAQYSISLAVHHMPGKDMIVADALSRCHLGEKFVKIVAKISGQRVKVPPSAFDWPRFDMGHFVGAH